MHSHAERGNDHHNQQKSEVLQLASSRLKPVLLRYRMQPVGPASAGKPLPLIGPNEAAYAASGTGFSREAFACDSDRSHALRGNAALDAPRLMVDAERQGMHSHAERGNDHHDQQKSQVP